MKRYSILLLLLGITICLLTIDQYNLSAGRLTSFTGMLATPTAGQHRNTDLPKSDTSSKPTERVERPTHQIEAYRLPLRSLEAQRLMKNPGSGVRLELSDDGIWLTVWHYVSDTNTNEPLLRQKTEYDQFYKSIATVSSKRWKNK